MTILGIGLASLLLLLAVFQVLLATGFPYGEVAWGGRKGKVLPRNYRIASAFSCIFFMFSILVVLSVTGMIDLFSSSFAGRYMEFLTVYLGLGIFLNAISRSKKERYWVPIIGIMFVLSLLIVTY